MQYDLVIDDGGHNVWEQKPSFEVLWPQLMPGASPPTAPICPYLAPICAPICGRNSCPVRPRAPTPPVYCLAPPRSGLDVLACNTPSTRSTARHMPFRAPSPRSPTALSRLALQAGCT